MNLSLFCGDPNDWHDIDKPFVLRGWKYATDKQIAVRVPSEEQDGEGTYPGVAKLFTSFPACEHPWPQWERSSMSCARCVRGRTPKECTVCEGSGEHVCGKCKAAHVCGKCAGEGVLPSKTRCPWCEGTGGVKAPEGDVDGSGDRFVAIDGVRFGVWYLWLIESNLSNLRYVVRGDTLCFTARGGVQGKLVCMEEDNA